MKACHLLGMIMNTTDFWYKTNKLHIHIKRVDQLTSEQHSISFMWLRKVFFFKCVLGLIFLKCAGLKRSSQYTVYENL